MRNISFDNPYLLWIAIPLLLAVVLPFAIAIRKDNVSKSVVASLVLHVLMVACITFATAGLTHTTEMTQTHVYVVADVSYSSNRELDTVDEHIRSVKASLPANSKLGIVCFGKDQQVLTDMGGGIQSVTTARVDASVTDIASALTYTANLFQPNVIKHIVLITDGNETCANTSGGLISAIENLYLKNIAIDAIYVDTNITEDIHEVQISEVQFTEHTYKSHSTTANVLVESNREATAIVTLYQDEEKVVEQAVALSKGYNVISFDLDTSETGTFGYTVKIDCEGDNTLQNNTYSFTQQIEDVLEVLLLTKSQADLQRTTTLYGEKANIYAPLVPDAEGKTGKVPFTVEEMCYYDEIVLSNFDIRTIGDSVTFMDSLDQAVSRFGKSLVTVGDTNIQNMTNDDEELIKLENMLPVKFGNAENDPKLYAIVLDISHSLYYSNKAQLGRAKKSAKAIVNLLADQDYIMITPFWGSNTISPPEPVTDKRTKFIEQIDAFQAMQGTMLGSAMQRTYDVLLQNAQNFASIEMFVITDGLTAKTDLQSHNPVQLATRMLSEGIVTSTIYVQRNGTEADNKTEIDLLKNTAKLGGGSYYAVTDSNVDSIMLNEVAESLTESVIERVSEVDVKIATDKVMEGINSLPQVSGYINSKAKANATTVLTTKYQKSGGSTVDVPIYSYWNYGTGKVSTFTSTLSGNWASAWQEDMRANTFLTNVLKENTPKEKNSSPYTLTVNFNGFNTGIEIVPVTLNAYVQVQIEITRPNGTSEQQLLSFDSQKYGYTFDTPELGCYSVKIEYIDPNIATPFTATTYFNLSYELEYNAFAVADISNLKNALRNRGTVHTDGKINLATDKSKIDTYEVNYTVPLLIVAVALYVVDIVVRKMKIEDFKMLFSRKRKGGEQ